MVLRVGDHVSRLIKGTVGVFLCFLCFCDGCAFSMVDVPKMHNRHKKHKPKCQKCATVQKNTKTHKVFRNYSMRLGHPTSAPDSSRNLWDFGVFWDGCVFLAHPPWKMRNCPKKPKPKSLSLSLSLATVPKKAKRRLDFTRREGGCD